MTEDWDITTGDGTVSVYLPRSFGAEVDAHTGDGSIRSEIDGARRRRREGGRRTLKGRSATVGGRCIRTGDGAIRLRTH